MNDFLYMVEPGEDGVSASRIWPGLREPLRSGTVLELEQPKIQARLIDPGLAGLSTSPRGWMQPKEIGFQESFER